EFRRVLFRSALRELSAEGRSGAGPVADRGAARPAPGRCRLEAGPGAGSSRRAQETKPPGRRGRPGDEAAQETKPPAQEKKLRLSSATRSRSSATATSPKDCLRWLGAEMLTA